MLLGEIYLTKIYNNPWETVKQIVVKLLSEVFPVSRDIIASSIEKPPDPTLGDLASTIAFLLAKELKKSPVAVVNESVSRLESMVTDEPIIRDVAAKGPYINFFFDQGKLAELTVTSVRELGDTFGRSEEFKGQRALIESPAVNPSKPWHIGHARNAILGDTLCNMLDWVGYDVVRLDYVNDLGLQIAQLIWKLMQIDGDEGDTKYDHYLGLLYVDVQKGFDGSASVQEEVREVSRKLENLESKEAKLSSKMVTKCLKAQNETSYRLGIYHDYQVW